MSKYLWWPLCTFAIMLTLFGVGDAAWWVAAHFGPLWAIGLVSVVVGLVGALASDLDRLDRIRSDRKRRRAIAEAVASATAQQNVRTIRKNHL